MSKASATCTFLRYSPEQNTWLQNAKKCSCDVSNGGITIRDIEGSLVCDLPRASIKTVESMNSIVARINSNTSVRIALKFDTPASLQSTFRNLREIEIPCTDVSAPSSATSATSMPDLSDPNVQEFVLQLLFREDFAEFCADLNQLFECLADEI